MGWGEGGPGAQCHTALGRDGESAGSGQPEWLGAGWLLHLEEKKVNLSHPSSSLVQTPTATWCFSVTRQQEYAKSRAESNAGEAGPIGVCAQEKECFQVCSRAWRNDS